MEHLLHAEVMLPPTPRAMRPVAVLVARVLRAATVATMPGWMREMADLHQPRLVDVLVQPLIEISFRLVTLNARAQLNLLRLLSPSTVPVVAPVLLGIAPQHAETLTPRPAQQLYGYAAPAEAHLQWRARQRARVFDEGRAPSDEGLMESEPILGAMR